MSVDEDENGWKTTNDMTIQELHQTAEDGRASMKPLRLSRGFVLRLQLRVPLGIWCCRSEGPGVCAAETGEW